jgi:hypothetical protein
MPPGMLLFQALISLPFHQKRRERKRAIATALLPFAFASVPYRTTDRLVNLHGSICPLDRHHMSVKAVCRRSLSGVALNE